MAQIRNVTIFMSDSVRWDSHPSEIEEMGETVRTIASSLHTPTAITSILTGRYLPHHGVRGFTDEIGNELDTILDFFPNAALSDESGDFNDEIYDILLNRFASQSLDDISPPFAWFMRDPGGHAPYDGYDTELNTEATVREFFNDYAGKRSKLQSLYDSSLDSSVQRFHEYVLHPLEERDLLTDTLVIFISDHGELLGEYGHAGQSFPGCPELVYVPMTFIHPDLPDLNNFLARHVDLLPTVCSALETIDEQAAQKTAREVDGADVFSEATSITHAFSFYDRQFPSFRGEFNYRIESVWDDAGGHVFNKSKLWNKLKLAMGYVGRIPAGKQLLRDRSLEGLQMLLESHREWGSTEMTIGQARRMLSSFDTTEASELNMSDDTREHLEDLGYL